MRVKKTKAKKMVGKTIMFDRGEYKDCIGVIATTGDDSDDDYYLYVAGFNHDGGIFHEELENISEYVEVSITKRTK